MKKKLSFLISICVLAVVSLSCAPVISALGGYTQEQYDAQTAKLTDLTTQSDDLAAQNLDLQNEVEELNEAKSELMGELGSYQDLICNNRTWWEMMNVSVWMLSEGDDYLTQVEKDTQVSFFLTQWVQMGDPAPAHEDAWVLVVDYYSGIALNSLENCVILDPEKWPNIAK